MNRQEGLQIGVARELAPQETRTRITPEDFFTDGNSLQAREYARSWEEAQREGDLTAIIGCCDARFVYSPKNAIGIRAIAAVTPDELHGEGNVLSRKFGTRNAAVIAHHDGTTVRPRRRPKGCGGREEKAKMRRGDAVHTGEPEEGAARFVKRRVVHEDPIVSASVSAIEMAERSGIPVMGLTEDHATGKLIFLTAAMPTRRGGIEIISKFSLSKLLEGQYKEEEIYEDGIPALDESRIPDEFFPFLRRHESHIEELQRRNPNFTESQLVQNPDIVLLTSVIRPSRGRLPRISGSSSNRVFAITVARDPKTTSRDVSLESLQDASDELQYPLANAIASRGDTSKPFSALHGKGTVILETKSMDRSRRLAQELLAKPWFNEWTHIPGNEIMVAQTSRGIVDHAEYFISE